MDQKKSVIVFNRQNDLLDLTTPEKQNSFDQKKYVNNMDRWIDYMDIMDFFEIIAPSQIVWICGVTRLNENVLHCFYWQILSSNLYFSPMFQELPEL